MGLFSALADAEHLCTAGWADALGGSLAIFHGDAFGILHFLFSAAFDAICLHVSSSILFSKQDSRLRT